jgi:hypothetical protein
MQFRMSMTRSCVSGAGAGAEVGLARGNGHGRRARAQGEGVIDHRANGGVGLAETGLRTRVRDPLMGSQV